MDNQEMKEMAERWAKTAEGAAWLEAKQIEERAKIAEWQRKFEFKDIFEGVGPPPEGVDAKRAGGIPSGFIDEPEVYDEVHLGTTTYIEEHNVKQFQVLVDPEKSEVVAEFDIDLLPKKDKDESRSSRG